MWLEIFNKKYGMSTVLSVYLVKWLGPQPCAMAPFCFTGAKIYTFFYIAIGKAKKLNFFIVLENSILVL